MPNTLYSASTLHSKAYIAVALALSYAAMMTLAITVNLLPVFLTSLSADLGGAAGLTGEQLGRIGGTTCLGLVVAILVVGPLVDRMGAKLFVLAGSVLIGVGLAMLAYAPAYETVLVAVGVMGLGAGCMDMVLSPIVCALQPHRRSSAMNLLHSFYCIGAVATILVAALALDRGVGWRTIAMWMILMPLAVGGGFILLKLPPMVPEGQDRLRARQLIRKPYFLLAMAAIFLAGGTEMGMAQWLPAYAETGLHFSKWTGGMSLLAFSVAMAAGRIIVGVTGHRLNPTKMMFWCCGVSVVLFAIACFAPWPGVALAGAIAAGLTGSCLWPSMLAVSADRYPLGGASMFAVLSALGNAGGIFAPWGVGIIADHSAMNWGLSTAALCPLGMAALLVVMHRHRAPHGRSN